MLKDYCMSIVIGLFSLVALVGIAFYVVSNPEILHEDTAVVEENVVDNENYSSDLLILASVGICLSGGCFCFSCKK